MSSSRDDTLVLVPAQQLSPKKTSIKSNKQSTHRPNMVKVISKLQVGDTVRYLKVSNNRGKIFLIKDGNINELDNSVTTIKLTEHVIDIPNEDKVKLATMLISNALDTRIVGYAIETPGGYYIIQRNPSSILLTEINLVINQVEHQQHTESEMVIYPIVNPSHINDEDINMIYDKIRNEERSKCQEYLRSTKVVINTLLDVFDKYIKLQKKLFDKLDQVISDFESIQNEYIGVDIDDKDRDNLLLLTKTLRERHEIIIDLIRSCQNINNVRTYLNQVIVNIDSYNKEISKVFENIEYAIKD